MSKSAKQNKQMQRGGSTSSKKKTASSGTASKGKGRKVRDRAEVEKMNGMGSLGELQGRLSGKKAALSASQTKVSCALRLLLLSFGADGLTHTLRPQKSKVSGPPATTAELANSLAKTL